MEAIDHPPPNQPRRHWYQFSLRSLFVFMTLVGVSCSWVGIAFKDAIEQHAAVQKFATLDGRYTYDYQRAEISQSSPPTAPQPPAPEWLRKITGDDLFANVETACLGDKWTDAESTHLRGLRHLKELNLDYSSMGNTALVDVGQLKELEVLYLPNRVTDAGLEHLTSLHRLRELNISSDRVTDAGIAKLQAALPKCKIERQ